MTLFYIVRHGETDYNRDGLFQGQLDIPLNDEGRRQSRIAAPRMAALPLDVIYSSDLMRAQETARILAGDRPVALDPRLREIHVGRGQGLSLAEMTAREPAWWAEFSQDPDNTPFPGGESAAQVQARSAEALEAIHQRYPDGQVGLVTHGGVIKCLATAVLDLPLAARSRIVLDNCSLTVIEWSTKGKRLRSLNDTGHLTQAPSPVKADF